MWLAHVAAAALTLLLWNRGERAFWALLRLADRFCRSGFRLPPRAALRPAGRAPVARPAPLPGFHLVRVLAQLARRGPPLSI
jgi:hypothetical protein